MTVPATASLFNEYVADGAATPRSIGFSLRRTADLVVEADGVQQVEGQHYSVTGVSPAQSIVPLSPYWAEGAVISYYRFTERKQEYDIGAGVDLRNESLEDELDRGQQQQQEQDEDIARALKIPRGETAPEFGSLANALPGDIFEFDGSKFALKPIADTTIGTLVDQVEANASYVRDALGAVFALANSVVVDSFAEGEAAVAVGAFFTILTDGQFRLYKNGTSTGFEDPQYVYPEGIVIGALGQLETGAGWDGATAGTGFSSTPTDPARTTAKPALRLLTPPRQCFTDTLVVGVLAHAMLDGSLIGGISYVRFHYEGNTLDVSELTLQQLPKHDGTTWLQPGYWVELKKPAAKAGPAHLYIEAVPADPTMQSRVIGPFLFSPVDFAGEVHDYELTLDDVAAESAGVSYQTWTAARAYLVAQSAQNPKVTIAKAHASGVWDFPSATPYSGGYGRPTITAAVPVFIGKTGYTTDVAAILDPRYHAMKFEGPNITFDREFLEQIDDEGSGSEFWFDRIKTINSDAGRNSLKRAGPPSVSRFFAVNSWITGCDLKHLNDPLNNAQLAMGNDVSECFRDVATGAGCVLGNTITDHDSTDFWAKDFDAITITGPANSTVAISGGNDTGSRTITLKVSGVTETNGTFVVGKDYNDYAAAIDGAYDPTTDGFGYYVQDVADWINSLAGWSAVVADNTRRASALALPASKGVAFGDTAASAGLLLVTYFDQHSDFLQVPSGGYENVIAANNRGSGVVGQISFFTKPCSDLFFYNNPIEGASSTFKSQLTDTHSNVNILHNSYPGQELLILAGYVGDSYCHIAANAFTDLTDAGSASPPTIADNVLDAGATGTGDSGEVKAGNAGSKFADPAAGDFSPTVELLSNLVPRRTQRDAAAVNRGATTSAGALS